MTEISDIRDALERVITLLASIDTWLERITDLLTPAGPEPFVEWAEPKAFVEDRQRHLSDVERAIGHKASGKDQA